MEDVIHKAHELASLVGSLRQQGDDNSDLCDIIAQLEAAVVKRTPSKEPSSSLPSEMEIKSEIEEPTVSAEDGGQATPQPEVTLKVKRALSPSTNSHSLSKRRRSRQTKQRLAEDSSPTKTPRRKRNVGRPSRSEVTPGRISPSQLDDMDIDWVPQDQAAGDDDVTSPQGSCDAASFEEFDESADASDDEDCFDELFPSRNSSGPLAFNSSCKLCEVELTMKRIKAEAGETLAMIPSTFTALKLPSFSNLTAFANHLKREHMIIGGDESGESQERQASSSHHLKEQSALPSQLSVVDPELLPTATDAGASGNAATATQSSGPASTTSAVPYMACPHCEKKYNLHGTAKSCYDQLTFHMHRKHGEALPSHVIQYSCKQCSFQTLRRRDLTRHEYVVHTDHESRGVPCTICDKRVLPTSMVFHMAAVHQAEDVPEQVKARTAKTSCHICGKQFRGEINLQRHIKCVHNKIKEQLCHLCSQSFFAKRELQLHMFATHKINMSNMKVFKCPVEGCSYETLARRHLFIHNSVHSDIKNFTCEHCGKAFKCKAALSQHTRIMHTKDVKYTCTKCSFTSHAKQYVQRHMVIHSDVKKHQCDFETCTYATHFIENLTKHKRKHKSQTN